jgi:hypothetical protein
MAVPRLADALPFFLLDPASLTVPPEEAASSHVAEIVARKVGVEEMQPVDLVICGSVAVNRLGVRLGKGAGYSDLELALLQEAGLLRPETTIVTTVDPLQVVEEALPETGSSPPTRSLNVIRLVAPLALFGRTWTGRRSQGFPCSLREPPGGDDPSFPDLVALRQVASFRGGHAPSITAERPAPEGLLLYPPCGIPPPAWTTTTSVPFDSGNHL